MTDYEAAYRRVVDRIDAMQDEIDSAQRAAAQHQQSAQRWALDYAMMKPERDEARADSLAQAKVAGAGGEREARLMARVAELERWLDGVRTAMDE